VSAVPPNPYESPQSLSTLAPETPRPIWDEIEIEYDLTMEEYIAFNVHHLLHSPAQQQVQFRVRLWMTILLVLGNMAFLLYRASHGPLTGLDFLLHGIVGVATLLAFAIPLLRKRKDWRYRRAYERAVRNALKVGDFSSILGMRRCRVTKEWLETTAALWESRWRLLSVQRIEVTPKYAFVYVTPNQAIIFPARAFVSSDHFATFVTNLEGHTGKLAERFPA
jgi:hypothetical protein